MAGGFDFCGGGALLDKIIKKGLSVFAQSPLFFIHEGLNSFRDPRAVATYVKIHLQKHHSVWRMFSVNQEPSQSHVAAIFARSLKAEV